jgi:hypothetical protein
MSAPITGVNTIPLLHINLENNNTGQLLDDMKSIDMLEMSNHFKSVLDSKEKQLQSIKVKHNKLFKLVSTSYGIIRMMDDFMENIEFDDGIFLVIKGNIDFLRNNLSQSIHEYLPKENDTDEEEIVIPMELD